MTAEEMELQLAERLDLALLLYRCHHHTWPSGAGMDLTAVLSRNGLPDARSGGARAVSKPLKSGSTELERLARFLARELMEQEGLKLT